MQWRYHRSIDEGSFRLSVSGFGFKVNRIGSVLFWGLWNSVKTFHSSRVSGLNDVDALSQVSAFSVMTYM